MSFVVKDKVAVVFGGNGGIGKCTVVELFKHGAKGVLIVDQNDINVNSFIQNEIATIYGQNNCEFIKCDISNLTEIQSAFDYCIQQFGVVDIIINCAAILNENSPTSTITINLIGAIHIINQAYIRLSTYKSSTTVQGVICNIASNAALRPLLNFPSYTASKSGITSYAYCMGKQKEMEGDLRVKIVTICPTATDTPMMDVACNLNEISPEIVEKGLKEVIEERRIQRPESAAKCIIDVIKNGDNASIWLSQLDRSPKRVDYDALLSVATSQFA